MARECCSLPTSRGRGCSGKVSCRWDLPSRARSAKCADRGLWVGPKQHNHYARAGAQINVLYGFGNLIAGSQAGAATLVHCHLLW